MEPRQYRRPAIVDQIPLDRHSVIEASAGTGKTFTIEHLVIEILLNTETRLDQILAVTFTEKAAAELRARIRASIEKTLRGNVAADIGTLVPLDDEKAHRLEAALFSFERAPIHTIHSFCHRMLTDLAFQSGTRMAVKVVDARTIFHEAFRAELRERFAHDEWMGPLLEEWLDDDRDTDRLEALLFDAHSRRYLDSGAPARNAAAIRELIDNFDADRLMRELRPGKGKNPFAGLQTIAEAIRGSGHDPARLANFLDLIALGKLASLTPAPQASEQTLRFLRFAGVIQYAVTLEARIIDMFLAPVAERLNRLKRERGVIDFADMPGWLWSALEGPQGERLATTLRERFRFGLVDEFQDTDDLQWRIFKRVFVDGINNRLVVIGDPKQAIYAFRDADVFTYLQAKRNLIDNHGAKFVPLIHNFRSTADTIDVVNLIFAPEPPPAFFVDGDIAYDHPVVCARPEVRMQRKGEIEKPITVFSLPPGAKMSARRYRIVIGKKIAATLKTLLAENAGVEIVARDSKPVRARDVFVLTRTLMESREIASYLREAGVPYAFYKQDGLFQTHEAGHVLDTLRAVAEPHSRSHRLKAWSTPFFGVELRDLPGLDDVPPSHPLMSRMFEWKALADQNRFAELFSAMLHKSGLAARELLLSDSQRELTNYEHIFEILLENTVSGACDILDLILMLASWVDGGDLPPGENPGVQRLESERDAVQIMTVHKAKGLEANVVVLFGGYGQAPPQRDKVSVFHLDGSRQVIAGKTARDAAKSNLDAETTAENERLLYVGLTRARAKLYLAMFPPDSTLQKLGGYYGKLNERLKALDPSGGDTRKQFESLVEIVPLRRETKLSLVEATDAADPLKSWTPPASLLSDEKEHQLARTVADLVACHGGLAIDSYTSLQRRAAIRDESDQSIFKYNLDADGEEAPAQDLPGGRAVGIFLHEVIEQVDLAELAATRDLETWRALPNVRDLIATAARRHQVPNAEAWCNRGAEIVFNTLRSPLTLGPDVVPALAPCPGTREMEFTFPIPAYDHLLLGAKNGDKWKIERGLLVGFVDFVFRFRDRIYFADWKSDLLPSYDPATIATHVADHYSIQARIYTIGIVRLLRIRDRQEYEERFGGLVYAFIRGIEPGGDSRTGVYFHRPSWNEVVSYEQTLMAPA